jgi:hypothetical protein
MMEYWVNGVMKYCREKRVSYFLLELMKNATKMVLFWFGFLALNLHSN